jgi:hypothetical protein
MPIVQSRRRFIGNLTFAGAAGVMPCRRSVSAARAREMAGPVPV